MWEIVHKGDLIALEKHSVKGYERAVRPPGVRLILKNMEGKYLLTKEFRSEQNKFDLRLPGGKVFDDLESYLEVRSKESLIEAAVIQAAKIEAKEEAGIDEIHDLQIFSKSVAGASIEWDLYYLTGTIISMSEQNLGGDEIEHGIEIGFFTREEIQNALKNGDISEDRS